MVINEVVWYLLKYMQDIDEIRMIMFMEKLIVMGVLLFWIVDFMWDFIWEYGFVQNVVFLFLDVFFSCDIMEWLCDRFVECMN